MKLVLLILVLLGLFQIYLLICSVYIFIKADFYRKSGDLFSQKQVYGIIILGIICWILVHLFKIYQIINHEI